MTVLCKSCSKYSPEEATKQTAAVQCHSPIITAIVYSPLFRLFASCTQCKVYFFETFNRYSTRDNKQHE